MNICSGCGALNGTHKPHCPGPVRRRHLEPLDPPMQFMRGTIANLLPEVITSIPREADITITETTNGGAKALTITASWKEDQ